MAAHALTHSARAHGSASVWDPLFGTERKLATILSVDLKGSMALSRSVELEDWWLVIAELFEDMCEGVSLFGGWVMAFTGDGVMALFEGCVSSEAHPRRACQAALWLRDMVQRRHDELQRQRGLELSVRIGINSGEVLTGVMGRRHGRTFTANGYAIALAKRVETLATPGCICVSEHTAQLVRDRASLCDRGLFEVKGASSKIRMFELMGLEETRPGAHVSPLFA
ncbi:MAG: adenylate/guanylate cyclase domain-containing protein [Solirubrobacteraceae bacterium]